MRGKLAWAPVKWPKRRDKGPPLQAWSLRYLGTRHALHAVEDSAILLTVSMAVHPDRP
jgi:hypothetical protein